MIENNGLLELLFHNGGNAPHQWERYRLDYSDLKNVRLDYWDSL